MLDPEAYEIYSIVAIRMEGPLKPSRYSIQQLTSPKKELERLKRHIAACFPDTYAKSFATAFDDYSIANGRSFLLDKRFQLPKPYDLLTRDDIMALDRVRGRYWQDFFERYPESSGLLTFSAIGFSSDGTKAVVSVNFGCGWLCAEYTDYLLERKQGEWRLLSAESSCGGVS